MKKKKGIKEQVRTGDVVIDEAPAEDRAAEPKEEKDAAEQTSHSDQN